MRQVKESLLPGRLYPGDIALLLVAHTSIRKKDIDIWMPLQQFYRSLRNLWQPGIIAIEKGHILAGTDGEARIARSTGSARVGLPVILGLGSYLLDHLTGIVAGAIISNDDFEVRNTRTLQCRDATTYVTTAVIGGYDERESDQFQLLLGQGPYHERKIDIALNICIIIILFMEIEFLYNVICKLLCRNNFLL